MNPALQYVAVCVDGNHTVIGTNGIKEFRELDNGFMLHIGKNWYYTPYFFQHNELEWAWKFADGAREAEREDTKTLCPDKV